jgi:hypothetical protein
MEAGDISRMTRKPSGVIFSVKININIAFNIHRISNTMKLFLTVFVLAAVAILFPVPLEAKVSDF